MFLQKKKSEKILEGRPKNFFGSVTEMIHRFLNETFNMTDSEFNGEIEFVDSATIINVSSWISIILSLFPRFFF